VLVVLTCSALKETHWLRIKEITGAENVDLKKINLNGIVTLDITHTAKELMEIYE
jgi:hypothetical protein